MYKVLQKWKVKAPENPEEMLPSFLVQSHTRQAKLRQCSREMLASRDFWMYLEKKAVSRKSRMNHQSSEL